MAVGTPTTNTGNSSTPSCSVPAGVVSGNIVLMVVETDDRNHVFTGVWPAGFTQLKDTQMTGDGGKVGLAWKRLTAADSGSYTLASIGTPTDWLAVVVPLTGRHATNPPVISADSIQNTTQTSPVTITALTLTAVAGDDILFLAIGDVNSSTAGLGFSGWSAGYTEIVDAESAVGWCDIGVAKVENAAAGATGSKTTTLTLSSLAAGWVAWQVAFPAASGVDTRTAASTTGSKGQATATANKSAASVSVAGSRTSQSATVAKIATGASTTSARGSQTAVGIRSASSTSTVQARTGQTAVGVRRALGVSLAGARGSQAATGFKVATSASLAKAVGVDTATVFKIASSASLLFSKGVVVSIGSQPGGGTRTGSSLISARGAVTSTGFKVTTGASALKARTVTTATSFKLVSTASTAKARGVATATGIRSALANSSTGARSAASAVALKRVLGFSSVRAQTLGGAQATKTSGAISTVRARGVVISVHPPINATPFATPTTGPTRPHLSRSSDGHLDTPDMGSSGRIQIGRIS